MIWNREPQLLAQERLLSQDLDALAFLKGQPSCLALDILAYHVDGEPWTSGVKFTYNHS